MHALNPLRARKTRAHQVLALLTESARHTRGLVAVAHDPDASCDAHLAAAWRRVEAAVEALLEVVQMGYDIHCRCCGPSPRRRAGPQPPARLGTALGEVDRSLHSGSAKTTVPPAPVPGLWKLPTVGGRLALRDAASLYRWWSRPIGRDLVRDVASEHTVGLTACTPQAEAARRSMTLALNDEHDVMASDLATATRRRPQDPDTGRLLDALRLAVRLGEVVSALVWEGRPLSPGVADLPLKMAVCLLPAGRSTATEQDLLPTDKAVAERDLRLPAVRKLLELCGTADAEAGADVVLSVPARPRPGRTVRLRYAVLLSACVLVAYISAVLLHGPRGYWLPMTVAFIYKPDFGPVLRRAVHRCVGTVVGVAAIGAVALLTGNTPYALIGTVAVFGALMAVGVRHHYTVATTGLTGIVFVLVDLLGP
ncbi:FUSC family protein [Streptomyces sp. NPDC003233]